MQGSDMALYITDTRTTLFGWEKVVHLSTTFHRDQMAMKWWRSTFNDWEIDESTIPSDWLTACLSVSNSYTGSL